LTPMPKRVFVIHGDNDEWVPMERAEELRNRLSAKLIIVKGGGHFSGSDGVLDLPVALEELLNMAK